MQQGSFACSFAYCATTSTTVTNGYLFALRIHAYARVLNILRIVRIMHIACGNAINVFYITSEAS